MYTLFENNQYEIAIDDNENVGGISDVYFVQKGGLLRKHISLYTSLCKEELKDMISILQHHYDEKYSKK